MGKTGLIERRERSSIGRAESQQLLGRSAEEMSNRYQEPTLFLSGSFQGAGGIGGLLALTEADGTSSYYHSDGGGNVTALLNASQLLVAKYLYDPFGNTLARSGPKALLNAYRFSSKPVHELSGHYDYLYRWYAPDLQRWLNRDPIAEDGGINLYGFVGNNAFSYVDPIGLAITGQPYSKMGSGAGSVTINGTKYVVTTKVEFIVALKTSTSAGAKIQTFTYYGHGNPDDGGLSWAANKDPVTLNGYISPQELQKYLERFKDLFDPNVQVKLKSCGSANPNVFSSADAFKNVFPEAKVSGYTGLYLPYVGGVRNNSYFAHGESFPKTPHKSSWITK